MVAPPGVSLASAKGSKEVAECLVEVLHSRGCAGCPRSSRRITSCGIKPFFGGDDHDRTTSSSSTTGAGQMQQQSLENQVLHERQGAITSPKVNGAGQALGATEVFEALRGLPEAPAKLNKPKGLIDPQGSGKPQVLGEEAGSKFRFWAMRALWMACLVECL